MVVERTEELIIQQLMEGNEKAYRMLYEKHYAVLCHIANQYVKDDFLAETIVNDVIFHLWEIRSNLQIVGQPSGPYQLLVEAAPTEPSQSLEGGD